MFIVGIDENNEKECSVFLKGCLQFNVCSS